MEVEKILITKQMRRVKRKREQHWTLRVAALIGLIFVSSFVVNSVLNHPSTSRPANIVSVLKAAIVDQVSLTYTNETFVDIAMKILEDANYTVDYYSGEKVTVDFFRNLPTQGYEILVLRVHSTAVGRQGTEINQVPVVLFTSEIYAPNRYVWELLNDQLGVASFVELQPPYYFAITPVFVTSCMKGRFWNTTVLMMGCEGLDNTKMAKAFTEKGARTYISWKGSVSESYADQATIQLLQHLVTENQTTSQAVENTITAVGPDPIYDSQLAYYP